MNIKKMSKIIGSITMGILLLSQNIYASAYGNVNVSTLNIRASAGTDQKILGSVGKTDYIHILDKTDNGWYAIETDTDQLGYISGQYIDIQKAKGIVNANGVNIRSTADYSGSVIAQLYKNNVVYAHAQTGDWYLITADGTEGYIHREFLDGLLIDQLPNKKAATGKPAQTQANEKTIGVATTTINLREKASTGSAVLGRVAPATVLKVQNIETDWVKVITQDNIQGYVAKEYLNIGKESAKDKLTKDIKVSSNNSSSGQGSNKGADVVAYAKQFLGNPYVYGGNSLTNGTDCSGFTSQVYKHFGISLSRSSVAQYQNNGTTVNSADVQPGDLMFYGYDGKISHVALYMGNNQVIQASTAKTGITTGPAFRTSGKPLIGIKRVL